MEFTAANGVTWTRKPGGISTGEQLVRALHDLRLHHDVPHVWNWWQEGRHELEYDKVWKVILDWDKEAAEPKQTQEEIDRWVQAELDGFDNEMAEERSRRAELVTRLYDEKRDAQRLRLLRTESDAAFFGHVIQKPASSTQRQEAERRMTECRSKAAQLRHQIGDPDQIIDRWGHYPAERRGWNLSSHLSYWRYPLLRELATRDKRRFNALFKMLAPDPADMCSECQAPAAWHEYDLSLRLFQGRPAPDSTAERLQRLMPGWWERCPASTAYKIAHQWGGQYALPDFDGDQWRAMLPPMLRMVFAPAPPPQRSKPTRRPKPKALAIIPPGPLADAMAQLAAVQVEHPDAQIRSGDGGTWEVWPS